MARFGVTLTGLLPLLLSKDVPLGGVALSSAAAFCPFLFPNIPIVARSLTAVVED